MWELFKELREMFQASIAGALMRDKRDEQRYQEERDRVKAENEAIDEHQSVREQVADRQFGEQMAIWNDIAHNLDRLATAVEKLAST